MMSKKIDAFWIRLQGLGGVKKISLIILILSAFSLLFFALIIISANIIPLYTTIVIITLVLVFFEILCFLIFYRKIHQNIIIIFDVICSMIATVLVIASFYVNATVNLFEKIQIGDSEKIEYSVLVKKENTKLKGLGYIANRTIGLHKSEDSYKIEEDLRPKIIEEAGGDFGLNFIEGSSLYELGKQFLNREKNMDVLCLSQAQIQILSDQLEGFNENIKSIYNFQLDFPAYSNDGINETLNNEPFVLFLSVTDRFDLSKDIEHEKKMHDDYDNNLRKFRQNSVGDTHGYSEINQLLIVNPETNKILVLNIPANYYMPTDENSETGDTLANTGLIGVEESIEGLERLFGIKINYYLKTTFDKLEPLMRELGENNYDFDSETRKQEVLNVISNKMANSSILWRNYSPILIAAGNAFQTDIPVDLMTSLLKRQITSQVKWNILEYNIDGSEEQQSIAVLGNGDIKLQVLAPRDDNIENVKNDIQLVLDER